MRTEGINGLLAGVIPRMIKRSVGSSIAWTVYETLKERDLRMSLKKDSII